jgi:hypothetical protein
MNAQKGNNHDAEFHRVSHLIALYTNESGNRRTTAGVGISLGLTVK